MSYQTQLSTRLNDRERNHMEVVQYRNAMEIEDLLRERNAAANYRAAMHYMEERRQRQLAEEAAVRQVHAEKQAIIQQMIASGQATAPVGVEPILWRGRVV